MELWQLAIYGLAGMVMSILSGIAGAGAGFVTTPLGILLGLSPSQAVASGKLNGLGVAIGALSGMNRAGERVSKRRVLPIMALAFVVGLIAPHVITSLDSDFYRMALAVILLLMVPVVIFKKVGLRSYKPALWQKFAGSGLLTLTLFLQGVFSGGVGTLVNLVLMGMLGMTAFEANVTKRWSQLILNSTIVLGLIGSGLIQWEVAIVGFVCTLIGSFIGGQLAASRGNVFIMRITILLMLSSAIALIVTS
jgi:uncharacterized membrane protein YfcA